MMSRTLVLSLLLVGMLFAGCISSDDEIAAPEPTVEEGPSTPPAPDVDFSTAIPDLHDHENPLLHMGGEYLELVAHDDLTAKAATSGVMTGAYNEVDTCGTMAVVSSFAGNRGFTLVDLSDPANPEVLSQFPTASTNWDVRMSDDCSTVFVGMELGTAEARNVPELPVRLLGLNEAGEGGILVVDISEPTAPVFESNNEVGSSHNVYSFDHDNETYVVNEHTKVMKLVGERGSRTLEVLGTIAGTHDVSAMAHPITGEMYVFTGASRLSVFHFPTVLEQLEAGEEVVPVGTLDAEAFPGHTAWHEQTAAPALLDGRWILIGAGEDTPGQALPYSIIDITDPTTPTPLSQWMLPGAPFQTRGFYTFSPHNVAIRDDGRVSTANYHAGTWVFDISTQERQEAPVTLGYHFASELAPTVAKTLPYSPYVWGGEFLESGQLVTADLNSGLYVYDLA